MGTCLGNAQALHLLVGYLTTPKTAFLSAPGISVGHAMPISCLLQATLGLLLPTLLVWRGQVRAAEKWASEQAPEHAEATRLELERSPYMRLCQPALDAAGTFGWAATAVLLAVGVFAVVALSQLPVQQAV